MYVLKVWSLSTKQGKFHIFKKIVVRMAGWVRLIRLGVQALHTASLFFFFRDLKVVVQCPWNHLWFLRKMLKIVTLQFPLYFETTLYRNSSNYWLIYIINDSAYLLYIHIHKYRYNYNLEYVDSLRGQWINNQEMLLAMKRNNEHTCPFFCEKKARKKCHAMGRKYQIDWNSNAPRSSKCSLS